MLKAHTALEFADVVCAVDDVLAFYSVQKKGTAGTGISLSSVAQHAL